MPQGTENVTNRWCLRRAKSMGFQGNVPCGKTVTVGIDFLGEKSEGEKSVPEEFLGEESLGEKYMGKK